MTPLTIRRIDYGAPESTEQLARLQADLSSEGDVVSEQGRALTRKVFGDALSPLQVVQRICADVRARGLKAVLHFTEQFDKKRLAPSELRVPPFELKVARESAERSFIKAIRRIRKNVLSFQLGLLHRDAVFRVAGLHELKMRYRPMKRVGIMVPGGAAAYPSTLLMTVCPAKAAGVKEIAVVMPPTPNGAYNRDLLAVCDELGITEVYRIGGAQAVAALAYGVDGIPPVDMIVGPGNLFVALAKREVQGQVAIDCIAGPSEIVVIADESANPEHVAADLLAQAEHAPGASILIAREESTLRAATEELERQLETLPRGDLARDSLNRFGAMILAKTDDEIVECVNRIAPEHLHVATANAKALADRVDNAGAIFVGHYSPVALGDYAAGPSHVLPTGGTARFASGLCANDFLRRSSVLHFTPMGMARLSDDVRLLAEKEGLTAHAASVDVRLGREPAR